MIKRLAEYNHRKKEELAQLKSESKQVELKLTYYGAGAIVAIWVIRRSWLLRLPIKENS